MNVRRAGFAILTNQERASVEFRVWESEFVVPHCSTFGCIAQSQVVKLVSPDFTNRVDGLLRMSSRLCLAGSKGMEGLWLVSMAGPATGRWSWQRIGAQNRQPKNIPSFNFFFTWPDTKKILPVTDLQPCPAT